MHDIHPALNYSWVTDIKKKNYPDHIIIQEKYYIILHRDGFISRDLRS